MTEKISKRIGFVIAEIIFLPLYIVRIPLYIFILLEILNQTLMDKYQEFEDEAFKDEI